MPADDKRGPNRAGLRPRAVRALLIAAGAVLLGLAVLYNEQALGRFDPTPPLEPATVLSIRSTQAIYAVLALLAWVGAWLSTRDRRIGMILADARNARRWTALILLVLPLAVVELAGRPFVRPKTTLFVRDAQLGWRLRPGADEVWLGARVRINDKGLRGPELDWHKPPGTIRILYLGDSVTFGAYIADHEATFPYRVEQLLGQARDEPIETINAGVGGYSPWQFYRYLDDEGLRYDPDLVVVSFVLNDVIEESYWLESGQRVDGYQLRRTASSWWDRLASRSGLIYLAGRVAGRVRDPGPLRAPAPHDRGLTIQALVDAPDLPQVVRAWEAILGNMERIVTRCRGRGIAVILVAFPYRFQLADSRSSPAPQASVARFADEHGLELVDLLPLLRLHREPRHELFVSESHLSESGHQRVAEIVADAILRDFFHEPGPSAAEDSR